VGSSTGRFLCALDFGSCQFVNDGVHAQVDGEPLLSLANEGGRLSLSVSLYDDEDNALAIIENSEWVSGDASVWDLEADYQRLVIRQRAGEVRLRLIASRNGHSAAGPRRLTLAGAVLDELIRGDPRNLWYGVHDPQRPGR